MMKKILCFSLILCSLVGCTKEKKQIRDNQTFLGAFDTPIQVIMMKTLRISNQNLSIIINYLINTMIMMELIILKRLMIMQV